MMKTFCKIILCLAAIACSQTKPGDYSVFPEGTVLSGQLKDGNTLYLIRQDTADMAGICFVDDNYAVADVIHFTADKAGTVVFQAGNKLLTGKMTVNQATKEIELALPDIPAHNVQAQPVKMVVSGLVTNAADCLRRYSKPLFNEINADKDVRYGEALGYYTSKSLDYISKEDYTQIFGEMLKSYTGAVFEQGMTNLPLTMDIYRPQGDALKQRPVVVLIHGGAFFFGDKMNTTQQSLTDYLIKRGYVVASINYRLCSTLLGTAAIERTIYRGVQDTRAALRYLVSHQSEYGIDPKRIFLAGNSAGGIIALTTAFMDDYEAYASVDGGLFNIRQNLGGLDDSGNDLKASYTIAGAISMWGALTDLQMLNNPVPLLLFHGTDDDIIPCGEGLPFKKYMGEMVHDIVSKAGKIYGSESIAKRMKSLAIPARYVKFDGYGHEAHLEPDGSPNANMDTIKNEVGIFLLEHIFNYQLAGNTRILKSDPAQMYSLGNIQHETVQWHIEGGLITSQLNNTVRVVWFSSAPTGKLTACITDNNDVSCSKSIEIQIINK